MSAYTQNPQGPGQVISIGSIGTGATEAESITGITEQIESAMTQGRDQVRKIREEIHAMQSRHQRTLQEVEKKLHEAQAREHQFAQSLSAYQQASHKRERTHATELSAHRDRAEALQRDLEMSIKQLEQTRIEARQRIDASMQREERLKNEATTHRAAGEALQIKNAEIQARLAQTQEACDKARSEVELYKSSWSQVLRMERDARAVLENKDGAQARIRQLEEAQKAMQAQNDLARKAALQERSNASGAMRAAEEERARTLQTHNTALQMRKQLQASQAQVTELKARMGELQARIEELEGKATVHQTLAEQSEPEIQVEVVELDEEFKRLTASRTQLETERDALRLQLDQTLRELSEVRRTPADRLSRLRPPGTPPPAPAKS